MPWRRRCRTWRCSTKVSRQRSPKMKRMFRYSLALNQFSYFGSFEEVPVDDRFAEWGRKLQIFYLSSLHKWQVWHRAQFEYMQFGTKISYLRSRYICLSCCCEPLHLLGVLSIKLHGWPATEVTRTHAASAAVWLMQSHMSCSLGKPKAVV